MHGNLAVAMARDRILQQTSTLLLKLKSISYITCIIKQFNTLQSTIKLITNNKNIVFLQHKLILLFVVYSMRLTLLPIKALSEIRR